MASKKNHKVCPTSSPPSGDTPAWELEYIAEAKIWPVLLLVVFSTRHSFIFVVRMQCISVDFTSCGFVQLATYERRVADFMSLFAFNLLSNAR